MSGTTRTPIGRQPTPQVTPRAIQLFDTMMRIRCTCGPGERFACPGCKRWDELDAELGVEMKVPIWRLGCTISNPQGKNPYPPGTYGHRTWEPDHEGRELWLLLAAASREARRAKAVTNGTVAAPPEQPPTP